MGIKLFHKREVIVPTWYTLFLLLLLIAGLTVFSFNHIFGFLAVSKPAAGAEVLVVEGWMGTSELDQAARVFQEKSYDYIVTTGGPITQWRDSGANNNYAERAAAYLHEFGVHRGDIKAVPAPASAQNRTYLSAVMVREALADTNVNTLDVFSANVHARRSWSLYEMAFGKEYSIGIIAAETDGFDEHNWWKTSEGAKSVLNETISMGWTYCCFRQPAPGRREEKWGLPTDMQSSE